MSHKSDIQNLVVNHTRRLQKLKEQVALKGHNADPALLIEIEDVEVQLARLQAELASLASEAEAGLPSAGGETKSVNTSTEEKPTTGKRVINTGGGAYIEGSVHTGGGDFVGRDQVKTRGLSAADVVNLFEPIYARIEARPNTSLEDKADLKADVQELQAEVSKGEKADESLLSRRLRHIRRLAPDIGELVVAALTHPLAGFSAVIVMLARQSKAAGGDR
jgi:cell division septum initiation protein DivIVA